MRTWTTEKKPIEMLLFPGAGERPDCALAHKFEDAGIGLISIVPDEETEDDLAGVRLVVDAVSKFRPSILVGDSRGGRRVLQAAAEIMPMKLIVACEGWDRVDGLALRTSPHDSVVILHDYADDIFGKLKKDRWDTFLAMLPGFNLGPRRYPIHRITLGQQKCPIQISYWNIGSHGLAASEKQPMFEETCRMVTALRGKLQAAVTPPASPKHHRA